MIFALHGHPSPVHRLTDRRHNHTNLHVRGFKEEGSTTTPFGMVVLNNLARCQLALDAVRRMPRLHGEVERATSRDWTRIERHKRHIAQHGADLPDMRNWRWLGGA